MKKRKTPRLYSNILEFMVRQGTFQLVDDSREDSSGLYSIRFKSDWSERLPVEIHELSREDMETLHWAIEELLERGEV